MRVLLDLGERHAAARHELLEQRVGGGRRLHVEGLAAERQRQPHVPAQLIEDPPVLEHLAARRRLDERRLVLRVGLREADGEPVYGDALVAEGDGRGLEAEARCDDVVRMARGRGQHRVDHHQQFQRLERTAGLGLVGPGEQGIAADHEQRLHLSVARRQDLIGERRGRQPGRGIGETAHAQRLAETGRSARLLGARDARELAEQHTAVRDALAGLHPAPADGVEREHEVVHQHTVRCHAGAGAAGGVAARAAREEPGCGADVLGGDPGLRRDTLGRERRDRGGELRSARGLGCDEVAVLQTLGEDHLQHRRQQRNILTREALQVQVGLACGLGAPRVDDDELEAALARLMQALRGVEGRDTAPHRNQGVGTHQQTDIGVGEVLRPGAPLAVQRHRDRFTRLVDGGVGEAHRRTDGVHPGLAQHHARGAEMAEGAAVHRHRARAVTMQDVLRPRRHLAERQVRRYGLERAVRPASLRPQQPLRRIVEGMVVAALHAAVAAVHGVVEVADDARDAPVLERGHEPAGGVAETADGGDFGHGDLAHK